MQPARVARYVIQGIALAIFGYQMTVAVDKYISFRSIPSVESKDVNAAKLPTIFICRKSQDQFNWSNDNGYGYSDFLQGILTSDFATWEGKNNITFVNITKQLYYPVMWWYMYGDPTDVWVNLEKNKTEYFTALNGYCDKLDLDSTLIPESKLFYVTMESTKEDFQVYFADPSKSLYYRINPETLTGDTIETDTESKVYTIDFQEIHWMDDQCTNYGDSAAFKTYADCIADEQEKIFRPFLGCMVPWLAAPDYQGMCKGRVPVPEDMSDSLWDAINNLKLTERLRVLGYSTACLKPCLEIKADMYKV